MTKLRLSFVEITSSTIQSKNFFQIFRETMITIIISLVFINIFFFLHETTTYLNLVWRLADNSSLALAHFFLISLMLN